ncbi:MAG: DUF4345 domain-containing protein [Blastocatellia bacterium]|nr:DUF4345 domain-containing protein [Blastocatellia bacterium]
MIKNNLARQIVLVLAALVFILVAIAALVIPHKMASQMGYTLVNINGLNEFRAIYVGVWFATAILLIVAAKNIKIPLLSDLGAILILGQTFGRLVSIILDGIPGNEVFPVFFLEFIGGLLLLIIRPKN